MPRHTKALGFSLVELVAIIVILSALAFFVLPRLQVSDSSLLTSRDALIAALSHAQQIAMARDSDITLVLSANSVDLREDGSRVNSPGAEYPLTLPNSVTITGGTGTLNYDKLGRTDRNSALTISLNNGQASVTVEESGYAH